jgi:hypothetical protein
MHDRQSEDALNGDPLVREIERAVAVDPSPEFLARVTARLAEEPSPAARTWPFRWVLVTTGLAVTAGVVAMLYPESPYAGLKRGSEPVTSQVAASAVDATLDASIESEGASRQEPVRVTHDVQPATTSAEPGANGRSVAAAGVVHDVWRFPNVIVSPAEADALRALVADAYAGRFAIVPAVEVDRADPASDPEVIVIEPLEIQPLVKLSREELAGEIE